MYKPGDHYALCDVCGFRFYRSQLRKTWDGRLTCADDWEPRHPQDTIRPVTEQNKVKDARPETTPTFLNPGDVTSDDL